MNKKNYILLLIFGIYLSSSFVQSMRPPFKKSKTDHSSSFNRTDSNHSTGSQEKLLQPSTKKTKIDLSSFNPFQKNPIR